MKTKIIFIMMAIVFSILSILLPSVYANVESLGTYRQSDCIVLKQTCSNCSYNNITSIKYPNSTSAIDSQVTMTKSGTEFTYDFCNTSVLGNYIVNGYGDVDGTITVWAYDFDVTPTGDTNNLGFYIMLTIIIIGTLIFGVATRNIPVTLIGSMITMSWGVYIAFNGFDVFKNSATEFLSIGIIGLGAVWIGIAGLEYFDVI